MILTGLFHLDEQICCHPILSPILFILFSRELLARQSLGTTESNYFLLDASSIKKQLSDAARQQCSQRGVDITGCKLVERNKVISFIVLQYN